MKTQDFFKCFILGGMIVLIWANIVGSEGFPNYEAAIRFIGEYPANEDPDWSDRNQGVTHDCCNWYFTQTYQIWKIPVGVDLMEATDGENGVFFRALALFPEGTDYPDLLNEGYDHFGDPCYYEHSGKGFLVVPVEDNTGGGPAMCGILAFFRPEDLSYIDHCCINNGGNRAPWCAVDLEGQIYSSIDSDVFHINIFHVDWDLLFEQNVAYVLNNGSPIETFQLKDSAGNPTIISGDYLQGGDFTPSNELLYLVHGNDSEVHSGNGIHIFEMATGRRVAWSSREGGLFHFLWDPSGIYYDEPEGMTYWDLDDMLVPGGITGQLHVILNENDPAGNDNVWFKHYTNVIHVDESPIIPIPWALQRGTVYAPYSTVSQAANLAWDGSIIRIVAGNYPEAVTITKKVRIEPKGGHVIIGEE